MLNFIIILIICKCFKLLIIKTIKSMICNMIMFKKILNLFDKERELLKIKSWLKNNDVFINHLNIHMNRHVS